jgi:hypothetical protein
LELANSFLEIWEIILRDFSVDILRGRTVALSGDRLARHNQERRFTAMWSEDSDHTILLPAKPSIFSDDSFAIMSSRLKLARLLTDREFLETVKPLSDHKLRRHDKKCALKHANEMGPRRSNAPNIVEKTTPNNLESHVFFVHLLPQPHDTIPHPPLVSLKGDYFSQLIRREGA